jgi:hypothetical protein
MQECKNANRQCRRSDAVKQSMVHRIEVKERIEVMTIFDGARNGPLGHRKLLW